MILSARPGSLLGRQIEWWFRDRRSGQIVIAHVPNLPILLWLATVVARWLVAPDTAAAAVLAWAGSLTLAWWAVDELVRGVNPWRRALGLGGCAVAIVGIAVRFA